jgi:hypothetical protein
MSSRVDSLLRRAHFYLGLYFLFFIWLFALTGLLLNNSDLAVWFGGNERQETQIEQALTPLVGGDSGARARDVMAQLGLRGEIGWPPAQPDGFLTFNVNRPNESSQVRVDLAASRASVRHFDNSGVATVRIFHTFSGSRYTDDSRREWWLTTVWVAAMDAVAIGLVLMVIGSYPLWWRLKKKRATGMVALVAGIAACAALLW